MSDALIGAVEKFMDSVDKRLDSMREQIRNELLLELRSAPAVSTPEPVVEVREEIPATPGVTLEEMDARIEARFRKLQVRTFADVYREVYRDEEQYARGDVVTYGGSLWLAKSDSKDERPGTSDAWRLIVKKGADAKR